jgi:peptide/nickel transport system permease protein
MLIGIPLGVLAALTSGRWPDLMVRLFANVGYAVPLFLTALWLQYFLYYKLGWFPSGERLPPLIAPPPTVTGFYVIDSLLAGDLWLAWQSIYHLILPASALALSLLAIAARFTRASLLTELDKEYVRIAHVKGISRSRVVVRHALRNSLIPVVTMTGIQFGYFVGGSVLVETVFLWPGLGLYAFNSINALDYEPIMGVTLVTSFVFVMTNLVIDLLYPVLDPRIKMAGRR